MESLYDLVMGASVYLVSGMAGLWIGSRAMKSEIRKSVSPLLDKFESNIDQRQDALINRFETRLAQHESFEEGRYAKDIDLKRLNDGFYNHVVQYKLDRRADAIQRTRLEGKVDQLLVHVFGPDGANNEDPNGTSL